MVRSRPTRTRGRSSFSPFVGLLGLLVAIPLLCVWEKVELARAARAIERNEVRIGTLREERSKLMAAVVFQKKPGAIETVARGELGMEYPAGRWTELTFEMGEMGEVE
ncbi:MAG: hypothetical protein HOC74_40150 [Gemmatimonadetes bacterium]|jgi:hypothetical protein|nr:hypothetical protein [Gemmatimonadota bacterium]